MKSNQQKTVTLSTAELEIASATICAQTMMYVWCVMMSLGLTVEMPMILEIGNKGAVNLAKQLECWRKNLACWCAIVFHLWFEIWDNHSTKVDTRERNELWFVHKESWATTVWKACQSTCWQKWVHVKQWCLSSRGECWTVRLRETVVYVSNELILAQLWNYMFYFSRLKYYGCKIKYWRDLKTWKDQLRMNEGFCSNILKENRCMSGELT